MINPEKPIIDSRVRLRDEGEKGSSEANGGNSDAVTGGNTSPGGSAQSGMKTAIESKAEPTTKGATEPITKAATESPTKTALEPTLTTDAGAYMDKGAKPKALNDPESSGDSDAYSGDSYATLLPWIEDYIRRHAPKSKEDIAKEQRRRKAEGIISGISDAARAVSNLIFTNQYAPDMYDDKNSMSAKTRARYEKAKAERDAEDDRFFQYAMTYGRIKDAKEEKEYQRGRDELQDRLRQIDAGYKAKMADVKYRLATQKLSDAEAAAEVAKINRDLDIATKEAKLEEIRSRTGKNNRWTPRGGGSRGGRGRKPYGTFLGETYDTKADYEKAVEDAGVEYNVGNNKTVTSGSGIKKNSREVKKPIPEKAAEIERKAKKQQTGNSGTGGNSGGNGKKKGENTRKLGL